MNKYSSTGGAGYIGSHTCVTLMEAGHMVIVNLI
ncbi:MAG: NAD-dependent epimerase/dehydratase family protein [Pelotomaculum sp.]